MKTINDNIHRQLLDCHEGRQFLHDKEVEEKRKEKRAIKARDRYLLKISKNTV
jgi:hypothetical protein